MGPIEGNNRTNEDSHQDPLPPVPAASWDVDVSQGAAASQRGLSPGLGATSYWLPAFEDHTQTPHMGGWVPPGYSQDFPVGEYSQSFTFDNGR